MGRVVTVSEQVRREVSATESPTAAARVRRLHRQGEDAGRGKGAGWRRSADDDRLLDFLIRFEALTETQAAKWFYGGSMTRARRRIGFMEHSGLVQKDRGFPAVGVVIIPTRAAARAVYGRDTELNRINAPAFSRVTHLLFVAEVAAGIMNDPVHPREVISEREIRLYHDRGDDEIVGFLRSRGVTIATAPGQPGVWPTRAMVKHRSDGKEYTSERNFWITVRTGGAHASYRIPDLIEIRDGELWAVEIEIAEKDSYRLKEILAGYRDCSVHHAPVEPHDTRQLSEIGRPIPAQFRGVRWVCSPDVAARLTGPMTTAHNGITDASGRTVIPAGEPVYGVDPVTNNPAPGYVEEVWAKSATGRRMFAALEDKALTNERRPVVVETLTADDQPGLEFLLAQATLSPRYRADFTEWAKWRTLWADAVAGDPHPVAFTRWLRLEQNYLACIHTTRGQNRAMLD